MSTGPPRHRAPTQRRLQLAGLLARMAYEFGVQAPGRSPWEPVFLSASRRCATDPATVPYEDWVALAAAAFDGYELVPDTDELHIREINQETG